MGVTKYESVLAQALELPKAERELLIVSVGKSLGATRVGPTEAEFLAHLQILARHSDEHPDESLDWDDAEVDIFDEWDDRIV